MLLASTLAPRRGSLKIRVVRWIVEFTLCRNVRNAPRRLNWEEVITLADPLPLLRLLLLLLLLLPLLVWIVQR